MSDEIKPSNTAAEQQVEDKGKGKAPAAEDMSMDEESSTDEEEQVCLIHNMLKL